jgi:RHS repeat-associated protein
MSLNDHAHVIAVFDLGGTNRLVECSGVGLVDKTKSYCLDSLPQQGVEMRTDAIRGAFAWPQVLGTITRALGLLVLSSSLAFAQGAPSPFHSNGTLESQREQGATTLDGVQSYKYNAAKRLMEVKNPIGQINYSPDPMGNVLERSVSGGGTVKYEFDDAGRLVEVLAADGKQTRYSYDRGGRVSRVERDLNPRAGQPQVLVTHRRYDAADRLVAIAQTRRVGADELLLAGQKLTRIAGGEITRIETFRAGSYESSTGEFEGSPTITQIFEYDRNARLARETRSRSGDTSETSYDYDAAGNRIRRTSKSGGGTDIATYSYDFNDRLMGESISLAGGGSRAIGYTYDGNGNRSSMTEPGRVTLYRYNPQSRLIDIRIGATHAEAAAKTPAVRYAYDAQGNRVRKWTAHARSYLIDINNLHAHVAAEVSTDERIHYVRGLELIRQTRIAESGVEDLFPLPGHLSTSLGAVNANGDVVEEVDVDAFGNHLQSGELKQSHGYTGEYWDQDAQLLYLRARWYDPRTGRFISADPFEGKQRDPRSLNRYAYAHNDPLHNTDPTGLFAGIGGFVADVGIASAVRMGGGIAGAAILRQVGIRAVLAIAAATVGIYHASGKIKTDLEECIESARNGEHKCRVEKPTFYLGDDTSSVRDHVGGVLSDRIGLSNLSRAPSHGHWYSAYIGPGLPCSGAAGTQCDEYPFNATNEGGPDNYPDSVSLKSVDQPDNSRAGGYLGAFYTKCNITQDKEYRVVAVRGIARSGYICGK